MNEIAYRRLFGWRDAFSSPMVFWTVITLAVLLVAAPAMVVAMRRAGKLGDKVYRELMFRYISWAVLVPLMLAPVLLGAAWFMAFVGILSMLCLREFARATPESSGRGVNFVVMLGVATITFAVFDHWPGLFAAAPPLTISLLAAAAILADQPQGYIRRVALAVFGFVFIGVGLGHLGYLGNDARFREILVWLLVCVELNDIFAYLSGKTFGRRKLCPNTSPNKTVGGAVGALVLTTLLAALLGHFAFAGTVIDQPVHLIALGALIAIGGQFGDLMLSSVKRDLGIKDMGTLIPGHGGLLDRFDSLLLVAPALFHYLHYFYTVGDGQPVRIFSG